MQPLLVNIDTGKSFTLFEACPEPRCHEHTGGEPYACPTCEGRRGRQQAFDTVEELREYLLGTLPRTLQPGWPISDPRLRAAREAVRPSRAPPPRPPGSPSGSSSSHQFFFDKEEPVVKAGTEPSAASSRTKGKQGGEEALDTPAEVLDKAITAVERR